MMDLAYVVATLLFFALMLAYTVGCERLGRSAEIERGAEDTP